MSFIGNKRLRQHTLSGEISFEGVGLHSGSVSRITVRPSREDSGIFFRLIEHGRDAKTAQVIPASASAVVGSDHGTTLANGRGASISTVEHLMAAFALLGVDNAQVDVEGTEIPILDGSSSEFVKGIRDVGLVEQRQECAVFRLSERREFSLGDRSLVFEPSDHFSLRVDIEFDDCLIGRQSMGLTIDDMEDAVDRLAGARTFCRLDEVRQLRAAGLIRGGSLENSIVVDGHKLVDGAVLRDSEEFVWHKALDLIGDLYLLGGPICAAVHAVKPGHALNTMAAKTLLSEQGQTPACQSAEAAVA